MPTSHSDAQSGRRELETRSRVELRLSLKKGNPSNGTGSISGGAESGHLA